MRHKAFVQLARSARQRRAEEVARRLLAHGEHEAQLAIVRAHVR